MGIIIDGNGLAKKINQETSDEVRALGCTPSLAIVLVGDNSDSKIYVDKKIKKSKELGMEPNLYKCDDDSGQAKILEVIDWLNNDNDIDGILLQLPLPNDYDYDVDELISRISPAKDLDRFHPKNIDPIINTCDVSLMMPPVFGAVLEMLKSIDFELDGMLTTVISNSEIFGGSMAKVLSCQGASVQLCSVDDPELREMSVTSDLLISAIGKPKFIDNSMVKDEAVVIDIGFTRENKKLHGDVDFEDVKDKVSYISPVPGGVGPLTVAMTLRNALELYKKSNE